MREQTCDLEEPLATLERIEEGRGQNQHGKACCRLVTIIWATEDCPTPWEWQWEAWGGSGRGRDPDITDGSSTHWRWQLRRVGWGACFL